MLSSFPQNVVENLVDSCEKLWIDCKACYKQALCKEVSFVGKNAKIIHRKPVDNYEKTVENTVFFCGLLG